MKSHSTFSFQHSSCQGSESQSLGLRSWSGLLSRSGKFKELVAISGWRVQVQGFRMS